MITRFKQIIFTDKKKDGSPLMKWDKPFKMLHIELEDWKWISKFYKYDEECPELNTTDMYNVEYKENGIYFNIVSIYKVPEEILWLDKDEYNDPDLQII